MAYKYTDYINGVDFTGKTNWVVTTAYVIGDVRTGKAAGAYVKIVYTCSSNHTSGASTEPGVGADWATVWTLTADGAWATPYKTITDGSTAAGAGANEVRCKASPADTAIGGTTWVWTDTSTSVTCGDGVDHSADVVAKDIIGNVTVGWWEVASVSYSAPTTTIVLSFAFSIDGGATQNGQTIVKRGVTAITGVASTAAQSISVNGTSNAAMFWVSGAWTADGVQGDGITSGQQTTFHNSAATRIGWGLTGTHTCIGISKLHFSRWERAFLATLMGMVLDTCNFISFASYAIQNLQRAYINNCWFAGGEVLAFGTFISDTVLNACSFFSIGNYAIRGGNLRLVNCKFRNNGKIFYAFDATVPGSGIFECRTCTFVGTRLQIVIATPPPSSLPQLCVLQSYNENGTVGNHRLDYPAGYYVSQTARRHTASGLAWTLYPNAQAYAPSASGTNYAVPLEMKVAEISVAANVAITASIWIAKSNTAAAFEAQLICKGGQLSGIAADVVAVAGDADTSYHQVSLAAMTPTEAGVLELYVQTWGSASYYTDVDDFAVV